MKSSSFLVGLLSVSAVLLAALLVFLPASAPQARAEQTATFGDYTLISTGLVPNTVDEFLTVVDNRGGRMITYQLSMIGPTNGKLAVVGTYDLNRAFTGR